MAILNAVVVLPIVCLANVVTPTKPGFNETSGLTVFSGAETTVNDDILLGEGAEFRKAGAGTLTVPLSKVNRQKAWGMTVSEGTLRLTPGADATAPADTPPAALQKAALWLSAEKGPVTSGTGVTKWVDVRDAEHPNAASYPVATPFWTEQGAAECQDVPPELMTKDGRTAVFFGGKGSGKYMKLSSGVKEIYHQFVVHGVYSCFGSILGSGDWGYGMVPDSSKGVVEVGNAYYYERSLNNMYAASAARHSRDGLLFDPFSTPVKTGFQLMSSEFLVRREQVSRIFLGHISTKIAYGGDYLCEVVLFTQRLSSGEVQDVERYLMRKYNLPHDPNWQDPGYDYVQTPGRIGIASNATAEVAVAADESLDSAIYIGAGTVRKMGAGTMIVGPTEGKCAAATLDLVDGTVKSVGGQMLPVALSAGDRYDVSRFFGNRTREVERTAGATMTRTVDSAASDAVKAGDDRMLVNEICEGVKQVRVNAGVLQLVGKAYDETFADGPIEATVENSDFELPFMVNESNGRCVFGTEGLNGWRGRDGWINPAYISASDGATWFGSNQRPLPPSGTQALLLWQKCSADTTVTVPKDGDYDVEFWAVSRRGVLDAANNTDAQQAELIRVYIGETEDSLVRISGDSVLTGGNFVRFRYHADGLTAGSYVLRLEGRANCNDGAAVVDDVRMVYVGKRQTTAAFNIPYGDFEDIVRADAEPYHYIGFSVDNTSTGWTLTSQTAESHDAEVATGVGIVAPGLAQWYEYWWMPYEIASAADGGAALYFMHNDGSTAETTFVAPRGRFRLSADVAWCPSASAKVRRASAAVQATLTLANGTTVNLGYVQPMSILRTKTRWNTAFDIDEPQSVKLTLSQLWNQGVASVDNLAFVSAGDNGDGNYLKNPGAENETRGTYPSDWAGRSKPYSEVPWALGYQAYEGRNAFILNGADVSCSSLSQEVAFDEAGTYRLTFHIRSRANAATGCWLRLWTTKSGSGVTNDIDHIESPVATGFLERSYVFVIPEQGNYRIGFSCVETSDRTTFLDGLSVRRVAERLEDAPTLPEKLAKVDVADGARVVMDYTGTMKVRSLTLSGQKLPVGRYTANDYPDWLGGVGAIEVCPPDIGMAIIVR